MATYQGAYTGPQIDALLGRVNNSPGSLGLTSVITVQCNNVSDSKRTFTNDVITASMVVVGFWCSVATLQKGTWTITTSTGSISIAGEISGTGNVTFLLSPNNGTYNAT